MAEKRLEFNLDRLKTDPNLWKRFAMAKEDDDDTMENVFPGKENPFNSDPHRSMEKIQQLAAAGKLYVREFGRSRHFQKATMEENELVLGEQKEARLTSYASDPIRGLLMRMSRAYFNWVGPQFVANWIDRRIKRREEMLEIDGRAKAEYKSMDKDAVKRLKEQRKTEKQTAKLQKQLQKLQDQLQATQQQLNRLQGNGENVPQATEQAPLEVPPEQQPQNNIQQPPQPQQQQLENQLQQQPQPQQQQQQPQQQQQQPQMQQQQAPVNQQPDNPPNQPQEDGIILNGKKYDATNLHELPESVQAALQMIKTLIALEQQRQNQAQQNNLEQQQQRNQEQQPQVDQEQLEQNQQQPNPNAPQEEQQIEGQQMQNEGPLNEEAEIPQNEEQQVQEEAPAEEFPIEVNEEVQAEEFPIEVNEEAPAEEFPIEVNEEAPAEEFPIEVNEEVQAEEFPVEVNEEVQAEEFPIEMNEEAPAEEFPVEVNENPQVEAIPTEAINEVNQPEVAGEVNEADMQAPLNQPANLEPDRMNIHEPHPEPEPGSLAERLAQEKQDLDRVKDWRNRIADSLFSGREGDPVVDYLHPFKDDMAQLSTAMTGIACGVLTQDAATPEERQQVIDKLLSGQSLGQEHSQLVQAGLEAYKNAKTQMDAGNNGQMEQLLANAAQTLSQQASLESKLTSRNVMIGRLISNVFKIATNQDLDVPMNEEQRMAVQGAAEMGLLAQRYLAARQYLGNNPMDLSNDKCKNAVCDLLAGSAVQNMLAKDVLANNTSQEMQGLMGELWTAENMRVMVSSSGLMRKTSPEQIRTLLEEPNTFQAYQVAAGIETGLVEETRNVLNDRDATVDRAMGLEQQMNQPEHQAMNPMA